MRFIFALLFLAGVGCNYNRSKVPGEDPNLQRKIQSGPLDFATVKTTVLGPRCLNCHADYKNFATVKNKQAEIKFRSLIKRNMPTGGLSNSEANILAAWFDQGAPEFIDPNQKPEPDPEPAPEPTPVPAPEPITFAFVTKNVFSRHCNECHSGPIPADGVDMTDLPTVRFKANRIFQRVFVTKDMPEPPLPGLDPGERELLLKWFDLGMPE